jgi:DNA-directed RNA polymerase specialized sigma24 family protein
VSDVGDAQPCSKCGGTATVIGKMLPGWVRVRCLSPECPFPEHTERDARSTGAARRSDPETSRDAAKSIDSTRTKQAIVRALRSGGPMNRSEIAEATGIDEPEVWRRLSELEAEAYIRLTGDARPGSSGRAQRVYETT